MTAYYDRLKDSGICTRCGKEKARDGMIYCEKCAAEKKKYDLALKEIRAQNRANGLCACGRPPEQGHRMCRWCRGKQAAATKRYLEKKKGNTE